jgi:prepilin-type N-terminal cleavage/methylation domain-containing protein
MTFRKNRGFSLLELMIVVGLGLTLAGVSFIAMTPMMNKNHLDEAYDTTLMALRNTRQLAIAQSHEYWVTFTAAAGAAPATITVNYQPGLSGGVYPAQQLVNTYTLPVDVNFAVWGGSFPASTPDGFGSGVTAIDFGYTNTGTGGQTVLVFMPDGSARDGLDLGTGGDYDSGVLYLTRPTGTLYQSRAITVWGTTGRIRGWWLSQTGGPIWVQQ